MALVLKEKMALAVGLISVGIIAHAVWSDFSVDADRMTVVEGRGAFVAAERKFHGSRNRSFRSDWEEICALIHIEKVSNLFHRCFAPRDFAVAKLEAQPLNSIRVWVSDASCAGRPQDGWRQACPAKQIEVEGKLIATPTNAPSCSIFAGTCPPREPGPSNWKDIKQFPLGVEVGVLKPADGAPRHYLTTNERGYASEWVEYRFVGFDGPNGSINIFRGTGFYTRPEEAMIDVRALQHEIFLLPGTRYAESVPGGSFAGIGFLLLKANKKHHCIFYAGTLESDQFTVRGWYCAPQGQVIGQSDARQVFEGIRVLPPALARL